MKLNLEAKTDEQKSVKEYLETYATEELANKINNGVKITKDNKELVNKKNLDGFFSFASSEAHKLVSKGAQCACVKDAVVFGWAIHYFEEDSIEGTLYETDGTPYKKPLPKTSSVKPSTVVMQPAKPKSNQISLFDSMLDDKAEKKEEVKESPVEQKKQSPIFKQVYDAQEQYKDHIVLIRLGDFYETFGSHAETLANLLGLTLTSRDCGDGTRVPMVGFPHHCAELYFNKIKSAHKLAIVEDNKVTTFEQDTVIIDDEEDDIEELSVEEMRLFDGDIDESFGEQPLSENDKLLDKLYRIFGDTAIYMG